MTRTEPRRRGVLLNELDRDLVYRIHYTGRRWEVLGPEAAPESGRAAGAAGDSERAAGSRMAPGAPRHAAPAAAAGHEGPATPVQ